MSSGEEKVIVIFELLWYRIVTVELPVLANLKKIAKTKSQTVKYSTFVVHNTHFFLLEEE